MLETKIDSLGLLAQLDGEVIFDYEAIDKTITTICTELLALQVHTTPITLGIIEPVVTRSLSVQQDTIGNVISKLRETVGGYISVDVDRKLNWLNDIGEDKGQQIRYKKNITGLNRTLDYASFANRLYCYGEGEGTARIHLSQALGMTEDYVENIPSQTLNGMCMAQLTDKSITDPDVLLAWANLKLVEMQDPCASYTVDMVNLVAMGWTFEAIQLGSIVKVIDEDLGIDIDARIVKVKRDLSDLQNIEVEISNIPKDIIDTMSGVYDNQQFQDHLATKMGAGQVIVLGAFTVQDWVTGGTTNIKGDYIRTGVVQSNNWGVGAGSQFNLNDGTFKLGGSTSPKLSWDGATLLVYGVLSIGGAAADVNAHGTTINGGKITAYSITAAQLSAGEIITNSAQIKNAIITDAKINTLSATKITGQVVNAQIANIDFAKIYSVSITNAMIVSLAASKITSQIVNAQIANIDFAKIYSVSITSAMIVSLEASKISTQILNAQVASIDWAKITNVQVDNAVITTCSISKLIAGNLNVTANLTTNGYLKSNNFVAGASGWQIDYAGNAEFNNIVVRGTIKNSALDTANTLTINGTVSAGGGNVTLTSTALNVYGQYLKFHYGATYVGFAGPFGTTALWIGAAAGGIDLSLISGNLIWAGRSIYPANVSYDLGSATYYWDDVNYTDLFDRASAKPIFDSYTDVIKRIKIKKRRITIEQAEKEGMGKRTIKRIKKYGGKIEEFDLDTFPEDLLDIPTQEDYNKAEQRYKEISEYDGEGKETLLPIIKLTPKIGKSLNDLVYVILRSQQDIICRIETLEAK